MEEKLLRLQAVMDCTGYNRSKLYALVSDGKFPKPRKIEGCAVWLKSEVDAWIKTSWASAVDGGERTRGRGA